MVVPQWSSDKALELLLDEHPTYCDHSVVVVLATSSTIRPSASRGSHLTQSPPHSQANASANKLLQSSSILCSSTRPCGEPGYTAIDALLVIASVLNMSETLIIQSPIR